MKNKTCSFIGHRKIDITNELEQRLKYIIEDLILNQNVQTFLFGSRSEFDDLCHKIVTELKEKYDFIKRIKYTCVSESCFLENERKKTEETYTKILKKQINIKGFDEEFEHKTKYLAGKASYIERNCAMINDSDFCIFYYDENYKPKNKKQPKTGINSYRTKSGTALAYKFAKQKQKQIINTKLHLD